MTVEVTSYQSEVNWILAALVWWKTWIRLSISGSGFRVGIDRAQTTTSWPFYLGNGKIQYCHCALICKAVPFHPRQAAVRFSGCGPFKSSERSAQSCWCCCCCWWQRCQLIGCGCQGWGAGEMLLRISPPLPLSLSRSRCLSLSISLLLACIPLNNPHLGQAGWEAIQCSAPLCRLRKETERERQRFSTQEENREILTDRGRYPEQKKIFICGYYLFIHIVYISIYIFVHTHIDIYIYIYRFIPVHNCICACLFILIFLYVLVCVNIYDIYTKEYIYIYLWIYMRITVNQEKQEEISTIGAGLWLCGRIQYFEFFLWSSTSRGQRLRAHFVFLFSCCCFSSLLIFFFSTSERNKAASDRICKKKENL